MNKDQFQGKWHQIKGDVRANWGKLTDDDMERIGGNSEKLVGTIQERYGHSQEDAQRDVEAWFERRFPNTIDTA